MQHAHRGSECLLSVKDLLVEVRRMSMSTSATQAHYQAQGAAFKPPACGMCQHPLQPAPQRWPTLSQPSGRKALVCSVDSDRNAPVDRGVPERLATSVGLAALWAAIICESAYHAVIRPASAHSVSAG